LKSPGGYATAPSTVRAGLRRLPRGKIEMPCAERKPQILISPGVKDKKLPEAAPRALAEASERRSRHDQSRAAERREINGRGGLDPARYGDWEVKGIASDF
jgi:hypothetical protein